MFNPSQLDVRNFFFDTFEKSKKNYALTDLEKIAYSIILQHPEYHHILENKTKYLEFQWSPNQEQTNPFLHLSMHLTIIEQLSINQPTGITSLYTDLCKKFQTEHHAQHELMDCIAEMLMQAQKNNTNPDSTIYFNCIKMKLRKNNNKS